MPGRNSHSFDFALAIFHFTFCFVRDKLGDFIAAASNAPDAFGPAYRLKISNTRFGGSEPLGNVYQGRCVLHVSIMS